MHALHQPIVGGLRMQVRRWLRAPPKMMQITPGLLCSSLNWYCASVRYLTTAGRILATPPWLCRPTPVITCTGNKDLAQHCRSDRADTRNPQE